MKTLVTAVDAATAENPAAKKTAARPKAAAEVIPPRTAAGPVPATKVQATAPAAKAAGAAVKRTAVKAREVKKGVGRGSRRFGEAVWNPFVRLSGVLWLEVTGVFFGIMALFAGQGVWQARGEWRPGTGEHRHLVGAALMLVLFGYFCVSSFVRAKRRERKR
jgi:hypothetical protein